MTPIYYDALTKTAYYERADASLIIKTNYVPAFKELFDFYLSPGRKVLDLFWLFNNETLRKKYSSRGDFFARGYLFNEL